MLNGHAEPHLAAAEEARYGALFKAVAVGTGWRSRVIFETQGPTNLSCELGLGRNVLVGDHGFDGLSKTLDCIRCPGSHRSDCAEG